MEYIFIVYTCLLYDFRMQCPWLNQSFSIFDIRLIYQLAYVYMRFKCLSIKWMHEFDLLYGLNCIEEI